MTVPDLLPLLRKGTGNTPADGGCLVQLASYLNDGHSWTDATPCVHPVLRSLAIRVNDETSDENRHLLAQLAARLVGTGPEPSDPHEARVLQVRLAVWAGRRVLHLVREQDRAVCTTALDTADAWCEGKATKHAAYAASATSATAADAYAASAAYAERLASAAADAYAAAAYAASAAYAGTVVLAAAATAYAVSATSATCATYAAAAAYAAKDTALRDLLTGCIDEYDRLTGRTPEPLHEPRWSEVCDLVGAASP